MVSANKHKRLSERSRASMMVVSRVSEWGGEGTCTYDGWWVQLQVEWVSEGGRGRGQTWCMIHQCFNFSYGFPILNLFKLVACPGFEVKSVDSPCGGLTRKHTIINVRQNLNLCVNVEFTKGAIYKSHRCFFAHLPRIAPSRPKIDWVQWLWWTRRPRLSTCMGKGERPTITTKANPWRSIALYAPKHDSASSCTKSWDTAQPPGLPSPRFLINEISRARVLRVGIN